MVLSRDWTLVQIGPDEPFPYNHGYFLTDASGGRVAAFQPEVVLMASGGKSEG